MPSRVTPRKLCMCKLYHIEIRSTSPLTSPLSPTASPVPHRVAMTNNLASNFTTQVKTHNYSVICNCDYARVKKTIFLVEATKTTPDNQQGLKEGGGA